MEQSAYSPTIQAYDACLVVTGDSEIGTHSMEIRLDGIPTSIIAPQVCGELLDGECYDLNGYKIETGKWINGRKPSIYILPATDGTGYRKVLK